MSAIPAMSGAVGFSDVNLLVTTDVHSFISSHLHNDGLCGSSRCDADFGTLVSFIERVREKADAARKDVFVFDNGDVVDGTGLSTATKVDGSAVLPLLSSIPYDALNCGNHELYQSTTVLDGLLGKNSSGTGPSFVDFWKGNYLTSNILLAGSNGSPIGARYTTLTGKHGTRLLVMGWMYEMPDHCPAVNITPIATAVKEKWFEKAMEEAKQSDAIVVLAHMHYVDPLVYTLLSAIRSHVGPNYPVQFLTGHSHIREWKQLDAHAASFEAGNYGDTVGFAAFNTASTRHNANLTTFDHQFLYMTRKTLADAAGLKVSTLDTANGKALSSRIAGVNAAFGLSKVLGCAARTYTTHAEYGSADSLWSLYMDAVAPSTIFVPSRNTSQWFITSTGALRYDLYKGNVSVDDVDMALPFADPLYVVQRVHGTELLKALASLNNDQALVEEEEDDDALGGSRYRPTRSRESPLSLPRYVATPTKLTDEKYYDAIVGRFDKENVAKAISTAAGRQVEVLTYDESSVAHGGKPPASDTEAWKNWAASLPQPPCA